MKALLQDMIGGKAASLDPTAFLVHDQRLLMLAETLVSDSLFSTKKALNLHREEQSSNQHSVINPEQHNAGDNVLIKYIIHDALKLDVQMARK